MPNSIINSDDGVVSGTSGLKNSGGDNGVLDLQYNGSTVARISNTSFAALDGSGNIVLDTLPTQVVARQTFYAIDAGVPVTARSTDSNAYKIALEDTSGGTQRGFIGANSTNALMAANGSSTNVLNVTSTGLLQFNSGYGSVATAYGVRAWVNFDGATTIRASGGVSSVANPSTGTYTVNFSITMPDIYYAPVFFSDANSGISISQPTSASTTSVSFTTRNGAGTFFSGTYAGVVIVR